MTRFISGLFVCALLAPASAFAQQVSTPPTPPSVTTSPLAPRFWLVIGSGFSAARANCITCNIEDSETSITTFVTKSYPILVDVGVRVTPRMDAGVELYWVRLKVSDGKPIMTTFVLGVIQFRPWVERGLFLRAGMGLGIAGNGLWNPEGPVLKPPYTTNALGINFGVGWEFMLNKRWGFQVHAMQHVAALGELTTEAGDRIRNVVGNYWTVGGAIVIR